MGDAERGAQPHSFVPGPDQRRCKVCDETDFHHLADLDVALARLRDVFSGVREEAMADERERAVTLLNFWSSAVNPNVSQEESGAMSRAWALAAEALEQKVHWHQPVQAGSAGPA